MTNYLVLFAKPPLSGVAKTRLAEELGTEVAALVASALLSDTLALCESIIFDDLTAPELVLAYSAERNWFTSVVSDRWNLLAQEGEDLGQRLENALTALVQSRQDRTVFIGMDAPHLPAEFLQQAFGALGGFDTVLGPCDDGGYYLVGVRGTWPAGILRAVRWSTEYALADTHSAFNQAGLSCAPLPIWYDIGDVDDLHRLAGDLATMPATALPHVRAALQELGVVPPTGGSDQAGEGL